MHGLYSASPKDMVLSCFGLETGINFDNFGLELGMVFKGNTRAALLADTFSLKSCS